MTLTRLYARNFRNLEQLSWEPDVGTHLLLGDNGAGKTSLLEAIYVLATTRSFRATRIGDCTAHSESGFELVGDVSGESRQEIAFAQASDGTTRKLNGNATSLTEHLSVLPIVSWTAADLEWISGAPVARRKLLDRGVVGLKPGSIQVLARYRRALEQKRLILARRGGGRVGELDAWNEVLATAADELIRLRRAHVDSLESELSKLLDESDLELPRISLSYRPSPAVGGAGVEETQEAFRTVGAAEIDKGSPLVGPHRDELDIRWADYPARKVASAGERKLLGLAITACRARLLAAAERTPLLLLDDLDAELDGGRLAGIWKFFEGFPQVLVTSNRASVWAPFGLRSAWKITCGKLAREA